MSSLQPVHGFNEDAATKRLLRSRPPARALDWAADALGGGRVVATRALRGGMSSAMHLVRVAHAGGSTSEAVLRRYVRPQLNVEEPDIAEREARALAFVATVDAPTPTVLACDPTGDQVGVPAVLMSRLAGRIDWAPRDFERWMRGMVAVLPPIHATPHPPPGTIRAYEGYEQESYAVPEWARWPAMWERAVEIFHGPTPPGGHVFIHRDFHPGNVLWSRGRVTGVVDWASASIGPPSVDVGHCRGNLLRYGIDVADRFTRIWEDETGQTYDPWADIACSIGWMDGLRDQPPPAGFLEEEFIARAVAALSR